MVNLQVGSWTTSAGQWYDVTLIADGSHIEVWRGPKGGAQSRVGSVDTATVLSGSRYYLVVGPYGLYSFDDITVTAEDASSASLAYDDANQLVTMTENGAATTFSYDAWGRNTGKTRGSYAASYTYGFGDKIASATSTFPGEAALAGYNYDGLGKRRHQAALFPGPSSMEKWYRWSGWEETGEYAASGANIGALQTGYLPGLAAFDGADPSTATWRFALEDHLGSPRAYLAQSKAAVARQDFSPYGELMRSAGLPLTIGYTGHPWDRALGQYFAPFRYYNPATARWNMRDPLGYAGGPNCYAYHPGNPILYFDPFGLFPCPGPTLSILIPVVGGILGGVGFALGGFASPIFIAGAAIGLAGIAWAVWCWDKDVDKNARKTRPSFDKRVVDIDDALGPDYQETAPTLPSPQKDNSCTGRIGI